MNKPHKHAEFIKAKADGANIQYKGSDIDSIWHDMCENDWEFQNNLQFRIKPPAPKWPETTMTDRDLEIAYTGFQTAIAVHPEPENWRQIANAAIAHALETGQVVLKRDFDKAERALLRAGFVDHGGEEWKPPLGNPPVYVKSGFFGRFDGGGN